LTDRRCRLTSPGVASDLIVAGFDRSPAAERAVREGGALLAPRPALIVVVWKRGLGFELAELPTATIGLPPAPIDIRTALEIDAELYEGARRLAQHGANLAREAGLDAEGLAVAEDPEITVAETLLRVVKERDAGTLLLGTHLHGGILGATTRTAVRDAPCPVVTVRGPAR
jgi:nucleotide-binding universal stress UspA family protein